MKKAILKSLMILAAVVPTFAWSAVVYKNPLAGSDESLKFTEGTYFATTYSELTTLVEDEKLGNFDEVIKEVEGNDTQTHSVSLWVKLASLTNDQILWWVCGGSNAEHGGYAVKAMADGKLRIGKANANGTWNETNYLTTADSCLSANTWAHVTVTIAKTEGAHTATPVVYVNGVAKMFSGTATTFPTNLNGNGGTSTYAQIGSGVTVAGMKVYNEVINSATIAADYADRTNLVQVLPNPVYLLDAGSTATEGWKQINKNGSYGAFLQADTTYGSIYITSTSGGNFFNNYGAPENGFTEGSYVGLDGIEYGTVFEEMAATLGLDSIPESVYSDNLTNGGHAGHVLTVNGLDATKTYVMYYIGGATKMNGSVYQPTGGFQLQSYSGSPQLDYVATAGGTNTSVATSYTKVNGLTTSLIAGGQGYLFVRVAYVQATSEGKISFKLTAERSGICALAIAEINPPTETATTIDESSVNSSELVWTNDVPTAGMAAEITATTTTTVNLEEPLTAGSVTTEGEKITFTGDSLTTGATTVNADTDVSAITASLGTTTVASGKTLTIGANATTSVANGANTGTIHVVGGEMAAPVVLNCGTAANDYAGVITVATDSCVRLHATGGNKVYNVTGSGASSHVLLTSGQNWGLTATGSAISNCTLELPQYVESTTENANFWITPSKFGENVDFVIGQDRQIHFENENGTGVLNVRSLAGTGTILDDNAKYTVKITDGANATFGGVINGQHVVIKEGEGTQIFSGANPYSGGTTITGGTLKLVENGALGSGAVTVNANLVYAKDAEPVNTFTGSGTIAADGATLNLANVNLTDYTGKLGVLNNGILNFGEKRFTNATISATSAGTIAVTATAAEIADGNLILAKIAGSTVPANLKVEVAIPEGETAPDWTLMVKGGLLVYSTSAVKDLTWTSGSGSDWEDGLPTFSTGDNVLFGENNAEEIVTVAEGIVAGNVTIEGDYYFNGADLHANDVTVETDAQLTLGEGSMAVKYIRLTRSNPNTATENPAIAELILKKGTGTVRWPLGTEILQFDSEGKTTSPDWSANGNEFINALIDTVYLDTSNNYSNGTYVNPKDGTTGTYSGDASNYVKLNKWCSSPREFAVITLGEVIDFDGYQLVTADHDPRSPKNWILEASSDGSNWVVIDEQTDHTPPAVNSFYVYDTVTGNTIFPISLASQTEIVASTVTIAGTVTAVSTITADMITFEDGSTIAVSPLNDGPLVLDGEIEIVDTVEVTVPTVLQERARIPFLMTDDDSLLGKFTYTGAYHITYDDGIYYIGSSNKDLVADLTATTTWDTITWKNSNGDTISSPDFSVGDYSITFKPAADVTLTVPEAFSFITLTVDGTHTVELAGAKITAENIVVEAGTLKAGEATLQLVTPTIAAGATLDYSFTTQNPTMNPTIPSTAGAGTFVKRGTMAVLLADNTYETKMVAAEGVLKLNDTNHTKHYAIEVEDGATLQSDWSGTISSNTSTILLKGGATLAIYNGNVDRGSVLNAAITIDATTEKPAKIYGSRSGDSANIAGPISGKGAVEFGNASNMGNTFTVSGEIADGDDALKVIVTMTTANGVTFSGTNTYSGGTEIRNGGNLRVYQMANLGTGSVSIADTGKINFYNTGNVNTGHDADWNRLTGTGTVAFTASGNFYRTFPVKAKAFTTDLGVENNLGSGLILPEPSMAYQIGSLSGTGAFRVDFGQGTRSLEIIQSKDTVYSGGMLTTNASDRLSDIFLSGKNNATLSYTGTTTVAKPLTIKETGSLNLTGSWTGAVTVQAGGRLGGSGTIGGGVTLNADATLDMTGLDPLTVEGTVTLPAAAKIKVILPEEVGTDLKILSATIFAVTEMPSADVYIEGIADPVQTAKLETRADGLYLCMAQVYTRELTGGTTNWVETNAWLVNGNPATEPIEFASVELTMTADTTVRSAKPLHLTALNLTDAGSGKLTLDFDLDTLLTDDNYRAAPYRIELLRVTDGIDYDRVNVWTSGLKYGAMASIQKTATTITATITLPDSMIVGYEFDESISINFSDGGNHALTGTDPVGVEGYQVPADKWSQFGNASAQNQAVTLVKGDGSTETLSGALTYSSRNTHRIASADVILLRGYLDDGNTATISLTIPEAWDTYTAVIYTMTDTNDRLFRAKLVNETYYSCADGKLVVDSDADWGSSMARGSLIEGQNTMVIPDLTGDLTINGLGNNGARGCIAAIQVFKQKPIYDLELAPDICTAEVTGDDCAWSTLTWTPRTPTETDIAELVLIGDATLDVTGCADVLQVSVVGRNYDLSLIGEDNPDIPWVFNAESILAMKSGENVIPANVILYPGVIRYDYFYANDYTTLPRATVEFAEGFTGAVTPAGGIVIFSDETVTLTQLNTSDVDTEFVFSGTSRTAVTKELCFGQATVRVCDSAFVSTPKFTLAEGANDYTTTFSIEGEGVVNVTGATNVHTGATWNSCSVKIAHWPGNATLALSGKGRFLAENADMVLAHNGNATLTIADEAEVRVKGLVHHDNTEGAYKTSTVILNGGKLLVGETGIRTFGAAEKVALELNGGILGALSGTLELGADAETALSTVTISDANSIRFASEPGATIHISATNSSFLPAQMEELVNLSGGLRLEDLTRESLALELEGGSLEVAGALGIDTLTMADNTGLAFDGGLLTLNACVFSENGDITLTYPVREQLNAGGYIVLNNNAAVPNLSNAIISLALDSNRSDSEKLLPEYPLIVGSYTDGATPTVRSVSLSNNTNNAVDTHELLFKSGDLGRGLYVKLTGNDVLALNTVTLTTTTDYTLRQTAADAYPYFYFTSVDAGAKVLIPESGVAISHITFTGEPTCIKANSQEPSRLLQSNHISFATDMTFDLSEWAGAMPEFIRGAVANVPASICLISSGITVGPDVTLTPDFGTYELPEGFAAAIRATSDGVYLVVESARATRALSVNFTDLDTPLVSPPDKPGVYQIPVECWNDLHTVFSSAELMRTDLTGEAVTIAKNASDVATQLLVYNSRIVTSETAPVSLLKAWLNDSADQEIQLQNLPFDAYRVALIFSNDLEGAAYAPVTIGDNVYYMDGAGYLRKNIETYAIVNKSNGLTTLEIPGDSKWGSTDHTAITAPFVLGQNVLVTDILTDSAITINLPASIYDLTYSGLAAIQVIEAPELITDVIEQDYVYTFDADGTYELAALDFRADGAADPVVWEDSVGNNLTLNSDYDVTVILPFDFTAKNVTLSGSGKITLQVENNGGVVISKLDASALKDVTIHFPCMNVVYLPATGVTTFEAAFNNNGEAYTIAADATLILGANSGITTPLDGVAAPLLALNEASAGILRRNYVARITTHFVSTWQAITLAFKDGVRSIATDNSGSHLLIEEGDTFRQTGKFHLRRSEDWYYTQTGGNASFENATATEGGMLLFNNASTEGKTAYLAISGGRLFSTMISAWKTNCLADITVSETGTLALGSAGFRAQGDGAQLNATFTDAGTLELVNAQLNATNPDRISVTFNGGRMTTTQSEASLNFAVAFNGTVTTPTVLAPALGSTLTLNAANTGSGVIEVASGKVAIANVGALASTTTTVKAGATFESRGHEATTTMANTVIFEDGSTLSATAGEGVTAVRFADTVTIESGASVRYVLNDTYYSQVSIADGVVTFTTPITAEPVTWKADLAAGDWIEGSGASWENNTPYSNGADVTFPDSKVATPPVEVTVNGTIAPNTITWAGGSSDSYRFIAADSTSLLSLAGTELNMGSGQEWLVPVATAHNVDLIGLYNTYRLIGTLSNDYKTASLITVGQNVNGAPAHHAQWCNNATAGAILAPQPGETQIVSAMANTLPGTRSHMTGEYDVIITGGGTVQFGGKVGVGGDGVPFQNKGFSGTIIVQNNSTLDFTMVREGERPNYSFFAVPQELDGTEQTAEPSSGAPRYRGENAIALSILNGGTVRFSGCRNVYGGWANREDRVLLGSRPIEVGANATIDYAFGTTEPQQQNIPYGFSLIGDGAKLLASRDIWVSGGTTIKVSGLGEMGDKTQANVDAEGNLTAGITAEIAGGENTGLVPWAAPVTASEPLFLDVGEASTLNMSARLSRGPGDQKATLSTFTFTKLGAGRLLFTRPLQDMEVALTVETGTLGGTTTFSNERTAVLMKAGTVLEAGLSIPRLTLESDVELKINPTGKQVIYGDFTTFTEGTSYTVSSLLNADQFPNADGLLPIKVMGWNTARNATAVTFKTDSSLADKGYALEVRKDGLYLKRSVVYVRELDFKVDVTNPPEKAEVPWYAADAWYLQDDPDTKLDYNPNPNDAATALFILPETYATNSLTLPTIVLRLVKEVNFATIRFAVRVTETVNGETVETLRPLPITVIYQYHLIDEEMPGENEAKSFTWVPTLAVDGSNLMASVKATVPSGYDFTMGDEATVVVYASAANPAINVNFTSQAEGDGAWVNADNEPCGAVPFAGVYWTNASTLPGEGNERIHDGVNHTYFRISNATVVGVEASEEGQMVTTGVIYAASGTGSVVSRRGVGNAVLAADYLQGHSTERPTAEELEAVGMSDSGMSGSGWQVKLTEVPFKEYDLYLIFAAGTDGTVRYPAVRIKIGDADWVTYAMKNGWASPSHPNDDWAGTGGLVDGAFVEGRNVLHFRFSAPAEDSSLEIAPADNGQPNFLTSLGSGLAALQVIECTDGAANIRSGTGTWSAATGWTRKIGDATVLGKWEDATAAAPRYAQIPTISQLEADMLAQTPYLALNGSDTMTVLGDEGVISTGAVDLRNLDSGTTIRFLDDVFARAPNVILAPGITFTVPEGSESRTNLWRWVYDDETRDDEKSITSTFRKTGAADLTLARMMLNKIQVEEGTLWLSTEIDGSYNRTTTVTGDGTFGKTGAGDMTMEWSMLQTTGATNGKIIARCNQGVLQLTGNGGQSLPANSILLAEDTGVIRVRQGAQFLHFDGGLMKAVNGGTIELPNALNFFATGNRPSTLLEGGRFIVAQKYYNFHPHIYGLTSRGPSTLYYESDGYQAWNTEGLILWSGSLDVESGNLGFYDNSRHLDSLAFRVKTDETYGSGGFVNIAGGAAFYADLPIMVGDSGANNNLIHKIGAGTWIQTYTTSHGSGGNGGTNQAGQQTNAADIVIHEGTFRLNLGTDKLTQYPTNSERKISVKDGARLDGSAEISENTTVYIEEGATIASGVTDWVGISTACPGYAAMPAKFKHAQTAPLVIQGDLNIAAGATLEVDLSTENVLTVNGDTVINGNLTVRLVNLPSDLDGDVQLTNFKADQVQVSGTITCAEAIALDAEVVLENGNLVLKPSEAAYVWADQTGTWSDAKWTKGDEADLSFPFDADQEPLDDDTPVARVQAGETVPAVELTVDKGTDSDDGRDWPLKALVLSAEKGQSVTLLEGLTDPLSTPLPEGIELNKLWVNSTIWKLGGGSATIDAPISFYRLGAGSSLNVRKGSLTLTHPMLTEVSNAGVKPTEIPTAIEVAAGATLTYALSATDKEEQIIGNLYDPLEQVVNGNVTGEGAIVVDAPNSSITLKGTADNTLDYAVRAGTLALAGTIDSSATLAERTIEVAAGARLELKTETALGGASDVNWLLTAGAPSLEQVGDVLGAIVSTSDDARVRGNVTVVVPKDADGATAATFGNPTDATAIDGDFTLNVPANSTLALSGTWQTPSDCTAGQITKQGAGDVTLSGSFQSNLPLTVSEGALRVKSSVDVVDNNFAATIPAWVVESGAALVMETRGQVNLGEGGSLTIRNGATLDILASTPEFVDPVTFEDGAILCAGTTNLLQPASFVSKVTVNGVVTVNLDRLDPAILLTAGTASYKILDFGFVKRGGSGVFLLGGSNPGKWAEAGWTLTETDSTLILEAFGGTTGTYTWGGAETAPGNWGGEYWRAPNPKSDELLVAWPTEEEVEFPFVTLQDKDPLDDTADIPDDKRTLDWSNELGDRTLAGLHCTNSKGTNSKGDYTLTASGTKSPNLNISGVLLKTGDSKLIVDRPIVIGREGSVSLLGGELHLCQTLKSDGYDAFTRKLTLGLNSILRVSATNAFTGLLDGDGTGTIVKDVTGVLTLKSKVDALKALTVETGGIKLSADEQYAVLPEITLAADASLEYASKLTEAGDVSMVVKSADGATPAGTFIWRAEATKDSVSAPRLVAPADLPATVSAMNVAELRYAPSSGHLILDPGHKVLPESAILALDAEIAEDSALWIGSRTDAGSAFTCSALIGKGLVGVEPAIDLLADPDWATERTVTLKINPDADEFMRTFSGAFTGGHTLENTPITLGLTVTNADPTKEARFTLANDSTANTLGTLTAETATRVEVTGTWAGDVSVAEGATLAGGQVILDETGAVNNAAVITDGIITAAGRTLTVPAGATLSASLYGKHPVEGGAYKLETVPSVLTVNGTLALAPRATLEVLARTDLAGKPWVSTVEVNSLSLPISLADGESEVMIDIILDIEEGATASGMKILGWNSISGIEKINGRVLLPDGQTVSDDYIVRQKEDGLYLYRSNARFWMILR